MKKIALSGKKGNGLFALIDNEDFEVLSKYKWHFEDGYARTTIRENGLSPNT